MDLVTFCVGSEIRYEEIRFEDAVFNKYYEICNPHKLEMIAFPDGCIDVQMGLRGGQAVIELAGSCAEGGFASTAQFEWVAGLKLNPGCVPRCIHEKMENMVAHRLDISELFDMSEIEYLLCPDTAQAERVHFLQHNFGMGEMTDNHEILSYIIDVLHEQKGHVNIAGLVGSLGYSHRYSDRVFKNAVGFTIKKYASIFRLQEAVRIVREHTDDVYDVLGYYDQSHFIHDFKRFTSYTPRVFNKITQGMRMV